MTRVLTDLEAHAVKFWPDTLTDEAQESSVIPRLIASQEKFIGILYVADSSPTAWVEVLGATSGMPGNLFLKHLMVLTDVGGEPVQRLRRAITRAFPDQVMSFIWRGDTYRYRFQSLGTGRKWTNPTLAVDGPGLKDATPLTPETLDVAMLLLHGGTAPALDLPDNVLQKCCIGTMLGNKIELDTFVRQRYIHVSRITGGATTNTLGQLAQAYVRERLKSRLNGWDFSRTRIPGISQNEGRTPIAFDVVAESPSGRCCAVEVSFQVTTNSVIERKAGQARARQAALHGRGHRIAYVVDGAGNFERRSAVETICQYGDCVVTFRDDELDALANYLHAFEAGD